MKICINVNLKPGSLKEIDQFTVKLVLNGLLLGQMYLRKFNHGNEKKKSQWEWNKIYNFFRNVYFGQLLGQKQVCDIWCHQNIIWHRVIKTTKKSVLEAENFRVKQYVWFVHIFK